MPKPDDVGVGTAALIINEKNQLLLCKRKGAHAAGKWGCPGGWLDRSDETSQLAIARETLEECGIVIRTAIPLCWTTEDHEDLGARTVTLYHYCPPGSWSGEPQLLEPDKSEEWRWFNLYTSEDEAHSLGDRYPTFPGVIRAVMKLLLFREKKVREHRVESFIHTLHVQLAEL